MSVINKKPYIESVLGSLTQKQKDDLQDLINGAASIFRSYINLTAPITSDDKGVNHCVLEAKDKVFTGYLVYTDDYCVMFAYNGNSQAMQIVELYPTVDGYKIIDEELSVFEFRTYVNNYASGSGNEDDSNVYHFEEGDLLTNNILGKLKDGDVLIVNQMAFTIKKTNLTTHYLITGDKSYIADGNAYLTQLSWDSADEETGLTLTSMALTENE